MPRIVTLTSDFGTTDPWVGIMKGVIAGRAPDATVIDVTHGVPPQQVLAGALVLRHAVPWFPTGTVHVAVVDPGVGGDRRPLCVETSSGFLVGPDNGLLSLAAPARDVRRVVHLTNERVFLTPRSTTFHGRDVFAPVAASLATGTPPQELGPEVGGFARLTLPEPIAEADRVRGEVIYVDHFGNLVTNVPREALRAFPLSGLSTTIGAVRIAGIAASYSAVAPGEPVAVVNSWNLLEIAVRDGSARAIVGADVGSPVVIARP
jgi:hypothetical protein